jgi:heat shock protein HslJ
MVPALLVRTVLAWCLALAAQPAAQLTSGPRPLEGTYWKAIELDGRPVPLRDSNREIYLVLQERGRVYGSDGCNRVAGTYELKKTSVKFSDMAATRMACIDAGDLDVAFREAMKSARRLTVAGEHLELFDAKNRRVAVFLAASSRPADPGKG